MSIQCGLTQKTVRRNAIKPNLFSANQANCTNALGTTAGFANQGDYVTLTSSTDQPYGGAKALKVVVGADNANEGVRTDSIGIIGSTPYLFGALVHATSEKAMQIVLANNDWSSDGAVHFVGTGDWQWVTTTLTTKSDAWGVFPFITRDATEEATFYVGKMVLRQGTY